MFLLFAFSAYAQPAAFGGIYGYSGAGTPALYGPSSVYAPASAAQRQNGYGQGLYGYGQGRSGQSAQGQSSSANAPTPSAFENRFDRIQANMVVRSSEINANGNRLFYNNFITPSGTPLPIGLLGYGSQQKSISAAIDEQRIQDAIDVYRAMHPQLTQEDRDHLNDLQLQKESAHNQKVRRTVGIISPVIPATGGPLAAYYERQANSADEQLAQNSLVDARQSYREEPSKDNLVTLRNAQNDRQQAQDRRDANTFDLLGRSYGGAYRFAPILRKKASSQKLNTGYRNLRNAQDAYDKDPSEDNRLNVRLARLFVQGTEEEDNENRDEIVWNTFMGGGSRNAYLGAVFLNAKNSQDESDYFLRYHRLQRYILLRKQQQALRGGGNSGSNGQSDQATDGSQSTNQNPSSLTRSQT